MHKVFGLHTGKLESRVYCGRVGSGVMSMPLASPEEQLAWIYR